MTAPDSSRLRRRPTASLAAMAVVALLAAGTADASSTVYKWVDDYGTVHLSTTKPAAGVKYQTLNVGSTSGGSARAYSGSAQAAPVKASPTRPQVSPQQLASRTAVLENLQTRECVLALETLERLTSGAQRTTSQELRRIDQTVEATCSKDPARRREQEQMAAKLRLASGPDCVSARNKLADMMGPGAQTPRAQLQSQQAFVDEHCTAPVR